jgi:predicted secreted protein
MAIPSATLTYDQAMADAAHEAGYVAGSRAVLVSILSQCARELGYEDPLAQTAVLIAEREQAKSILRRICADHGDNEWAEDTHLASVIDKHLGRYLGEY